MATLLNNLQSRQSDLTTDFFNNFFLPTYNVSQDINEAVIAYFEQITLNKDAARVLAGSIIQTSKSQGFDPMETLKEFMSLPKGQLNNYLIMFLNLNRVNTSLLGITNIPAPSKYITRTLLP